MKIKKKILDEFKSSNVGKQLLKEMSGLRIHSGIEADVDDAIVAFHGNVEQYYNITKERAVAIGMTVLNYLIGKSDFMIKKLDSRYAGDFTEDGNYFDDDGNVIYRDISKLPQTTYFDKGSLQSKPGTGTKYTQDLIGNPAYQMWKKRIIQVASLTGWKFIDWLDANQSAEDSLDTKKNQSKIEASRKLKHKPVNIQQENKQVNKLGEIKMAKRKLSQLQKEYAKFFFNMLDEFEVETPADLNDDKETEFFNRVKKDWKKTKKELAKDGIKPVNENLKLEKLIEQIVSQKILNYKK